MSAARTYTFIPLFSVCVSCRRSRTPSGLFSSGLLTPPKDALNASFWGEKGSDVHVSQATAPPLGYNRAVKQHVQQDLVRCNSALSGFRLE